MYIYVCAHVYVYVYVYMFLFFQTRFLWLSWIPFVDQAGLKHTQMCLPLPPGIKDVPKVFLHVYLYVCIMVTVFREHVHLGACTCVGRSEVGVMCPLQLLLNFSDRVCL